MRNWIRTAALLAASSPGLAATTDPASRRTDVRLPTPARGSGAYRLKAVATPLDPALRLNDPRSMLQTSYGGSMIDLFPFEGGKFHVSGGGKLFGRAGRPRATESETLRPLQPFRAGALRGGRRTPALLVGYGRTVERGLALGVDGGMVMGKVGATPDRVGRLDRRPLDTSDGRARPTPMNGIARVTALYRF